MRTKPASKAVGILCASLLCGSPLPTAPAAAAPAGHHVVNGDVSIDQTDDGSVTVIHASDGSIIEYQTFDILTGELVEFVQPGADARVLNRVFGDATQIDGTLEANGIVYIVNPAGVFLNGNAVIDVGGLVAAAGNIGNEDFLSGTDRFALTGAVVNEGSVMADHVALLGTRVENHGRIQAEDGVIALVAGEKAVLVHLRGRVHVQVDGPAGGAQDEVGVLQAGTVDAGQGRAILAVGDHYALAINHTGVTRGRDVRLRGGQDGTLMVQGEIDASGEQGGSIHVIGDRVALVGATLDASGRSGGGSIRVGGGVRGEGRMSTARRTYVDADSVLRADATELGDGGSVVVWGDEAAVMAGTISARGGSQGGDGGFAEVSSLGLLDPSGEVDLRAEAGENGTFLIDPRDIVILGGTADGSDDPNGSDGEVSGTTLGQILFGDVGDGTDPFEIYESEIEGTDANLVLEARNSVTVSGTFDNEVVGEGTGVVVVMDDNDLTIRTRNDTDDELGSGMAPGIDLGSLTWRTGGSGRISFSTGNDGVGGGGTGLPADILVGDLGTEGGSIAVFAKAGSVTTGNLTTSGLDGDTGGMGGTVSVLSDDGDIVVGDVATRGGTGATGAGGVGGAVTIASNDGSLSVGSIDVSGGDGFTNGGNAGFLVQLRTADPGGSGDSDIDVGDVTAAGGEGLGGFGGRGGTIEARAQREPNADPQDPMPPMAGGDIALGNLDTHGGDGSGNGGVGGEVLVAAESAGSVTIGDIVTVGGDGDTDGSGNQELGGAGGRVSLLAEVNDLMVGAIDSSGGDGSTVPDPMAADSLGARGRAGSVGLTAGNQGPGSVLLGGAITAVDGAGEGEAQADSIVALVAGDAVEFSGAIVGPDIRTTEAVTLVGDTVGAPGDAVAIDAVGLHADPEDLDRVLRVVADSFASVDVTTAGFDYFLVQARSGDADIDITQEAVAGGGDAISIDLNGAGTTSTLATADMVDTGIPGGTTLELVLEEDDAAPMDDQSLELVVPGGAVQGSLRLFLVSEDDVLLEDGSIVMSPPDDGPIAPDERFVRIAADSDGDGTGSVQASGAGVDIDMNDGANTAGLLLITAAEGIGAPGAPIRTADVESLALGTTDSGGIHLENTGAADVTLRDRFLAAVVPPSGTPPTPVFVNADAVGVAAGDGDIEISTTGGGNLVVGGDVRADDDMSSGGNVTLTVDPGATIQLRNPAGNTRVAGAGDVLLDGDVELIVNSAVEAGGDVTFAGTVDSNTALPVTRTLAVTSGGTVRFGDHVGSINQLRALDVMGDVELTQDTSFTVLQQATFEGDVNASSDDAAAMTVSAGTGVAFGGDVGTAGRLSGLVVDSDAVSFGFDGDQSVVTGAGGIELDADGLAAPPALASFGKANGGLRLESVGGDVRFGPNTKLSVDGLAELLGDTVSVGDVSAQDIAVTANTLEIQTRVPGPFQVASGGLVNDSGVDWVANTITTDVAPVAIGAGAAPRFATASGTLDGAGPGAFEVVSLSQTVTSADLVDDTDPANPVYFDLGIGNPDPGNETEPEPSPVDPLLPARPGVEDAAGSAEAPGDDAVWAFLQCSEGAGDGEQARACAPAPGSPLDSPRGVEIAERHRRLFGGSSEALAARRLMTGGSAEASAVRRDVASLLAQLRLLGMDLDSYQRVRDRLLAAAAGADGREALLSAVRAEARGFPI